MRMYYYFLFEEDDVSIKYMEKGGLRSGGVSEKRQKISIKWLKTLTIKDRKGYWMMNVY